MTINSPEAYVASQWDWACLDGCFGDTKIKPADIDGIVERNGKFLVIETKLPNAPIPKGQEILMRALVQTGYASALFVWGHPGKPIKIVLWNGTNEYVYEHASLDKLRKIVNRWFSSVDGAYSTTQAERTTR